MSTTNLKAIRESRSLTQEAVSDLSGLHQTTVSALESGQVENPAIGTLQALARAYGLSLTKIIAAHAQTVKERAEAA